MRFSASELGLGLGDHISFKLRIDRERSWEWEGTLVRLIPAHEGVSVRDVVKYYGVPKTDDEGWYVSSQRRMFEKHRTEEEAWRENDFAAILRRYESWCCLKVDRVVFQKPNGSFVIMPDPMLAHGELEVWQTQTLSWRIA